MVMKVWMGVRFQGAASGVEMVSEMVVRLEKLVPGQTVKGKEGKDLGCRSEIRICGCVRAQGWGRSGWTQSSKGGMKKGC